jgi:cytochrome c-type biogenesis protein CcmH/NrfF
MIRTSQRNFLDLRRLIGLLLTFDGLVIAVYGAVVHAHEPDVSINLDLWWGMLVLVIGVLFLLASLRPSRSLEDGEE